MHHCSRGYEGGFRERLQEGTYIGHIIEHATLELLYLGGEQGSYGKTREIDNGRVRVVYESETEAGGRLACETAVTLVRTLWDGQIWDPTHLTRFLWQLKEYHLGPSTRAIVEAARRRGIPVFRMDDRNMVRLGQGCRQRRIMAATTDATSIIGIETAQDKLATKNLLAGAGIPVPRGALVASAYEAWQAAWEIGVPVVIKPRDGHHGDGVSMHLNTQAEVYRAFEVAQAQGAGPVVVEREVAGHAYRLLVVGNEMVAATERIPPFVVGDGEHTVRELVDVLNQDPRRGPGHGYPMTLVTLDSPALLTLAQQGAHPDMVPSAGRRLWVRSTANMSTGALARDITPLVHPELARDAVRAAQAVGLDIAGVDIVTPRLDASLDDAGGAVVEINAAPGLRMHLYPAEGHPQPVAEKIVQHLFGDSNGRIPVAAVTGTNGKTTVTRMLAHIWHQAGKVVGMSTTDGISIGDSLIKRGDLTGPWSARLVLNDPSVEVAVLETARGGMARGGLGFDDCDVAVVTNIGLDHLGQDDIVTLDDLVHLKSLLVDVVRPSGAAVLNADDERVMGMAPRCRGEVILFSTEEENPLIARHLAAGGRAVFLKRGSLYWGQGDRHHRLIGNRVLPASLGGVAGINVANAAAAAAAALAMGVAPQAVGRALATFPAGGEGMNRGRLEMLQGGGIRVLLDYGHNAPALRALGNICRRLKAREVVTVLGLPGDRRDQDIAEAARAVAVFSRRVVIREDADRRGRSPGEVAALIRRALLEAGLSDDRIDTVLDERQAVLSAIESTGPGGLVLVLFERYGIVRQAAEDGILGRGERQAEEEVLLSHA